MVRATRIVMLLAPVAVLAAPVAGQRGAANATVRWEPQAPRQGSFVFIVVQPAADDATEPDLTVSGSLAGQQLHFERTGDEEFRAVGAIPVNAEETILVQVGIERGRDSTHRVVRMPVRPHGFPSERLTVAPRFSQAPDEALQARIRSENQQSRAVSDASHRRPRMWHGDWTRPRPGRITSPFGVGRVFNGQIQSRHSGTDFDGDRGDPIRAANRGVVALVGDFYYAGNVVYLDHGAGLVTIYMHMSAVDVTEGQIVEKGEILGRVGATGRVTGPHLHWTARHGRVNVDPLTIFELDPTAFPFPAAVSQ